MSHLRYLTDRVAVAGGLVAADLPRLAAAGFATVINFRHDHEESGQLSSAEASRAAATAGLAYVHIPAAKHELFTDAVVERTVSALHAAQGPVVAYCTAGQRAAIVWAAAAARTERVDLVLATLDKAGFDLGFIRDDLEAQADRGRWNGSAESTPETAPAARELEAA